MIFDLVADEIAAQSAVLIATAGILAVVSLLLWRLDARRRRRIARLDALESAVAEARRLQGMPPEQRKAELNRRFGKAPE